MAVGTSASAGTCGSRGALGEPIDNNWTENQIRPWALGRKNWLFAGSLRSGKRAASIMSLIQSARLNGHDPYAYLKDVLKRLPTQQASETGQLLPYQWTGPSLGMVPSADAFACINSNSG
ncbi:transposase component [Pseudomonas poae RE*1-1-14]|nr:transposase component [Pseudomonas poae RE*1-1-14]